MLARRSLSLLKSSSASHFSSSAKTVDEAKTNWFGRKAVNYLLITITGGVALSALDDLSIYQSCTSKAMEKASKNSAIIDAIGEPIVKGPWYNGQLGVYHKRHSASCKIPVSGPKGTGVLSVKAVRTGDDTWLSYILPRDWDILMMDALVHAPENEENRQTMRITIADPTPACLTCTDTSCSAKAVQNPEEK